MIRLLEADISSRRFAVLFATPGVFLRNFFGGGGGSVAVSVSGSTLLDGELSSNRKLGRRYRREAHSNLAEQNKREIKLGIVQCHGPVLRTPRASINSGKSAVELN